MSGLPHPADVVERLLAAADGPCIAVVEESHEAEIRFANNTTTTNGTRLDRTVTAVRIVEAPDGVSVGVSTQSGDVDVAELIRAAEHEASLADDAYELVQGEQAADFGDHPAPTDLSVLSPVLAELPGAFKRAERGHAVLSGFAEHGVLTTYLGSSTGLRRRHVQPTGALQVVGRMDGRSAWAGAGTSHFTDVAFEDLEERVSRGLHWAEHQVDIPAGRHEVILPPEAVTDLMVYLVEYASGKQAEEGRTVFSRPNGGTRVGDVLSSLPFELWSDPDERGIECRPFVATPVSSVDVSVFDNGLPLERTNWIRQGKLERLKYHRAGAARSGLTATPPLENLVLSLPGTEGTVEDLVARTERGLFLTCLWYIRLVDPKTLLLTGLTRDGVYVVEDGKVVGAANNFRFNESPVDLLTRATEASGSVRALGRELGEWLNRSVMPALRIPDFNMSTVSLAN